MGRTLKTPEERIQARREYQAKWQHEHPEKVRQYKEKHILKKAAEIQARLSTPNNTMEGE